MDLQSRDAGGRWRPGASGNPRGRPKGSKDRGPRRQPGDRTRAVDWSAADWRVFYRLNYEKAAGNPEEKRGAAIVECTGLWLLLNPPPHRLGLCSRCGKGLDVARSSVNSAPIRADGVWVHWACLPWFLRSRWDAAKAALERLGLSMNRPEENREYS
jgi:hypothetical protein